MLPLHNILGVLWVVSAALSTALRHGLIQMQTIESAGLCLFRFATGIPCPGCGMGHAVLAAFQGEWIHSFRSHPLGILLLLLWTAWLIPPLRRRALNLRLSPPIGAAALTLVFGIYGLRLLQL